MITCISFFEERHNADLDCLYGSDQGLNVELATGVMNELMQSICPEGPLFSSLSSSQRQRKLFKVMLAMTAGISARLAKHAHNILADPTRPPQEMSGQGGILCYRFNINSGFILPSIPNNKPKDNKSGYLHK